MKSVRFLNSLITQILLFLAVLAAAISIGTLVVQMRMSEKSIHDRYASQAEIAVRMAASFVSAKDMDFYLAAMETDDAYYRLLDTLRLVQTASGMTYVFVTQIVDGGEIFVFDTDPDADTHVELGEFSDWARSGIGSALRPVLTAGEKPEPYISENEWGFFLTAREPIYRDNGTTAGYVGANFYMGAVLADEENTFHTSVIVTIFLFVASLATFFLIVHSLVAVPVRALTANVRRLSAGEVLPPILASRKNEFSLLEDAFIDMSKRNAYSKKITDALNKTAMAFLSQHERAFDDMMTQGLTLFCNMLNLDSISVWRNFQGSGGLHISRIYRWDKESIGTAEPSHGPGDAAFIKLAPQWESSLAEKKSINGPARLLPGAGMLQSFGIVSAFVAPLFINETFWGFALFEDHRDERYFDDDSADVMRSAALLCANTFIIHEKTQNEKKANEALARRIRYTDALNRMLELCVSRAAESVGAVLGNGLRPVADAASLDRILVFRVKDIGSSNAGEIYRWDRGGGGSAPVDDELKTLPVTAALKRWLIAMANDECVSLRRGEFTEDEAAFLSPRGVRSILIVPIFAEHGLWGFATFHDNAEERDFEDECIDMLRSSARLCTNILQRAEMENAIFNAEKYARELKIEADKIYYDFLTGIYGRRFLDENLNRVIATLFRSGGALSVMMADIDHFKKYNDTYGHDDGDKCLKAVAETLAKSLSRIDDFVVRYGGEEFAIVLPNTDEPGARLVAGRLLENVRKLRIPHEKNDAANCVTISIGVATGNVTGSRGGGEYMKLADEMLYQSKNKGRNRYTLGGL